VKQILRAHVIPQGAKTMKNLGYFHRKISSVKILIGYLTKKYTYHENFQVCVSLWLYIHISTFLICEPPSTDIPIATIDPSQSPYTVSVGTRLLLYCEAHAQPIPMIQWYKGTTPVNYIAQKFHQLY